MNNQQIPIADQLSKIISWRKINDHIRQSSLPQFWEMPPILREELGDWKFLALVGKIQNVAEYGTPDFSQTHSGGEISFDGNMYHWEICYRRTNGTLEHNPLKLNDDEKFTPEGWIELLGDWDEDHDPFPF